MTTQPGPVGPDPGNDPGEPPSTPETSATSASLTHPAVPGISYWLAATPPERRPALVGSSAADVVVIGAGFTGLWTAIRLLETCPDLRVVVLEAESVGFGASGRNGGFCQASLTHGLANGLRHFPDEVGLLEEEGLRNLRELVEFVGANGIDCDLERTGELIVADRAHQVDEFRAWADEAAAHGDDVRFLGRDEVRAEVHSPIWEAGLLGSPERTVMLDPAKLCHGLARAAEAGGARIHDGSKVTRLERVPGGVRVRTAGGAEVLAGQVVVATSAYSGWLRRLSSLFVPVYDYALVSERLTAERLESIGWRGRQGVADANNQFHYFRLTADDRILWGGYDAIYHANNGVEPRFDVRPATFERLESHFFRAFPQLAGLRFPFRWGGAIDTTSRFTVTFGQTMGGRVTYALGYTGLGVGASRWAAGVVRDFVLRPDSDLLRLRFVRSSPFPFPPEPFRYATVAAVRRELDRADRDEGRRGLLLRTLDALGIGFDS